MDIKKNNNIFNNKFKNLLANQPIDNLLIKSTFPSLKIVKAIKFNIYSIKKRKIYSPNIMIDNKYSLNYQNENDLKINQYINFLISQGIIIQQDNSSQKYILKEDINRNININKKINVNNFIIETINSIEILKKKKFFIPQIMAHIYLGNEDKIKNKSEILNSCQQIEKINSIQYISLIKKPFQKQLIDSIKINNEINSETINLIDKNISSKIINVEELKSNKYIININSNLDQNKLVKYIIQKNEEISILQKRIFINYIQYLDNFIIFQEGQKSYEKSFINSLFIPSNLKNKNEIQKGGQLYIIRKKKPFLLIDNIINLLIYSDEKETVDEEEENEENEENEEKENNEIENMFDINNIDSNNSNNEINNIDNHIKLRSKKVIKSKSKNKFNKPLIIMQNENLFIESTYDMLFVVKTWDNLELENNIKNLFIEGNENIYRENNIYEDIYNNVYNEKNIQKKRNINSNKDLFNNLKRNKIYEIKEDYENEKKLYKSKKRHRKNWNEIIFPKFNYYITILGNNKNQLGMKKEKKINNKIIKEIWFYIPGINYSINLMSLNSNNGYLSEDLNIYEKNKLQKNKNWNNTNVIQKGIFFNVNRDIILSNFTTPRNTEHEFNITSDNKNDKNSNYINNVKNIYNHNDNIKNKNVKEKNIINLKYKNNNINNNNTLNKNNNNNNYTNNINKKEDINNNNNNKRENYISKLTYKKSINDNDNNININNNKNVDKKSNINISRNNKIINNKEKIDIQNNNINNSIKKDNKSKSINLFIYNYSLIDNPNNIDNNNNYQVKYNTINHDINKYNEDIVNQGKISSEIILKSKNINKSNGKNSINISNSNNLIQKENNIIPNEGVEQIIEQTDYNYHSIDNCILANKRNILLTKKENKRYYEDNDDNTNIFPIKRNRTINRYNHFFKSKSSEKVSIKNNKNNMIKSNSEKPFELLRDYSFDKNQYD